MATGSQPVYGNYRGYYTKRPFVKDPRLALLPSHFFSEAVVLDIGCNEGWVTCEIAQQWDARKVVGVDIDPELIRGAWKRRRTAWSLQEPTNPSMEHMFGSVPIPSTLDEQDKFPHNISFYTTNWVDQGLPEDCQAYDIVLAFSVSKWIHLNGGDEGLLKFFRRVSDILKPGGKFVLEPQAWETYAKAKRMDISLKATARDLKIRPEEFSDLLKEMGFDVCEHLGMTGEGGFRRPVDVYVKH